MLNEKSLRTYTPIFNVTNEQPFYATHVPMSMGNSDIPIKILLELHRLFSDERQIHTQRWRVGCAYTQVNSKLLNPIIQFIGNVHRIPCSKRHAIGIWAKMTKTLSGITTSAVTIRAIWI